MEVEIENTVPSGNLALGTTSISTEENPSKKEVIIVGCGDCSSNLQDSFKKFLSQKKKEKQIQKMCRDGLVGGGRSQEYKDSLRFKFIETAKKYLGVPYAERYKADDAPIAPLYLDCCALVRRAVQDLQSEFGFIIGRWNQCYQMDTLPIVLDESQLKPGDLIFYEGIFNSNRSKPQKHNNVHVEIFLGGETGEATIGSRYHKGVVSIFPSYKFKSTTWDLVRYHFRSLDTWLNGECRSHCPEHKWDSDLLAIEAAAGKKSIFHDQDDQDDQDVAAAASDADNQGQEDGGGDEQHSFKELLVEDAAAERISVPLTSDNITSEATAVAAVTAAGDLIQKQSGKQLSASVAPSRRRVAASRSRSFDAPTVSPVKSEAGGGGGGAGGGAVRESKAISGKIARSSTIASQKFASAVDKVEEKAEAAGDAGGQKSESPKREKRVGAARAAAGITRAMSTSLDSLSKAKSEAMTYYVCKSNGWTLVKNALDKRGWQQLPFEYNFSTRFGLKWVERRSHIDYRSHVPGQLVCHIANNDVICSKVNLLTTMREAAGKGQVGSATRRVIPNWLPDTFLLNQPSEVTELMSLEEAAVTEGREGNIWIYKPACNNRGRGIQVFKGKALLEEICFGKQTGDPETTVPPRRGLIQRYIEDPLLVGTEGFKFDVRCYLLVARNFPSYLAFYHPGYCRLTLKPYNTSSDMLDDPTIHLTNAAVQKKDPLYQENKESQIRTVAAVAAEVEACGNSACATFLREQLDHEIKKCMADVLKVCISFRYGLFVSCADRRPSPS